MAKQLPLGWDDMIRPATVPTTVGVPALAFSPENKRKRRLDDRGDRSERGDRRPSAGHQGHQTGHQTSNQNSLQGLQNNQAGHLATNGFPLASVGSPHKRLRTANHTASQPLPLSRRLETLDHSQLVALIADLCQARPDLATTVARMTPAISAGSALNKLRDYARRISSNLPYKGDQANDYAFLRVQGEIADFFTALADYTAAFLPPHAKQPLEALEFLDGATNLVHSLPEWSSSVHNHLRARAYEELGSAWAAALRAAESSSALGVAPVWESRLQRHNELSGGRMHEALEVFEAEPVPLTRALGRLPLV